MLDVCDIHGLPCHLTCWTVCEGGVRCTLHVQSARALVTYSTHYNAVNYK